MKKINDDIARALDKCADALSIHELSRVTGVRIELLRRFITRKTRHARVETWDKIYPVLKPYLNGPEAPSEPPPSRIGRTYRRIREISELPSDDKILLDAYELLPEPRKKALNEAATKSLAAPTPFSILSHHENQLLGYFASLPEEKREEVLSQTLEASTAEVKKRRRELF